MPETIDAVESVLLELVTTLATNADLTNEKIDGKPVARITLSFNERNDLWLRAINLVKSKSPNPKEAILGELVQKLQEDCQRSNMPLCQVGILVLDRSMDSLWTRTLQVLRLPLPTDCSS